MNTNKLLLIIVVFVILAGYYVLGTGYLKGQRKNAALASGIDESTLLLMQIPPVDDDLQKQLDNVIQELSDTLDLLPVEPNTTQVIDSILRLGEMTGLKIIPVITQSWQTENIEGYNVSVFRFNLSVSGTLSQFIDFLSQLETSEYETLVIENLQVFKSDESSHFESISTYSLPVYADFQIVVYAQANNSIISEDLS